MTCSCYAQGVTRQQLMGKHDVMAVRDVQTWAAQTLSMLPASSQSRKKFTNTLSIINCAHVQAAVWCASRKSG